MKQTAADAYGTNREYQHRYHSIDHGVFVNLRLRGLHVYENQFGCMQNRGPPLVVVLCTLFPGAGVSSYGALFSLAKGTRNFSSFVKEPSKTAVVSLLYTVEMGVVDVL